MCEVHRPILPQFRTSRCCEYLALWKRVAFEVSCVLSKLELCDLRDEHGGIRTLVTLALGKKLLNEYNYRSCWFMVPL